VKIGTGIGALYIGAGAGFISAAMAGNASTPKATVVKRSFFTRISPFFLELWARLLRQPPGASL
jgi:hypothetical protein